MQLDPKVALVTGASQGLGRAIAAVRFLASDEAAYFNGAEIPAGGGMHLRMTALGSRRDLGGGPKP